MGFHALLLAQRGCRARMQLVYLRARVRSGHLPTRRSPTDICALHPGVIDDLWTLCSASDICDSFAARRIRHVVVWRALLCPVFGNHSRADELHSGWLRTRLG